MYFIKSNVIKDVAGHKQKLKRIHSIRKYSTGSDPGLVTSSPLHRSRKCRRSMGISL